MVPCTPSVGLPMGHLINPLSWTTHGSFILPLSPLVYPGLDYYSLVLYYSRTICGSINKNTPLNCNLPMVRFVLGLDSDPLLSTLSFSPQEIWKMSSRFSPSTRERPKSSYLRTPMLSNCICGITAGTRTNT